LADGGIDLSEVNTDELARLAAQFMLTLEMAGDHGREKISLFITVLFKGWRMRWAEKYARRCRCHGALECEKQTVSPIQGVSGM
jgi:hypothetical protein